MRSVTAKYGRATPGTRIGYARAAQFSSRPHRRSPASRCHEMTASRSALLGLSLLSVVSFVYAQSTTDIGPLVTDLCTMQVRMMSASVSVSIPPLFPLGRPPLSMRILTLHLAIAHEHLIFHLARDGYPRSRPSVSRRRSKWPTSAAKNPGYRGFYPWAHQPSVWLLRAT